MRFCISLRILVLGVAGFTILGDVVPSTKTSFQYKSVVGTHQSEQTPKYAEFLNYDLVLGWSTGHVGTTSLSEGRLYGRPDNIVFLHESNFGKFHVKNVGTLKWAKGSFASDYAFVREHYFPFVLQCRGHKQTLLDLGHHNLYFMDALIEYITKETKMRVLIVRIRRERHEAALSLTFNTPTNQYLDLCAHGGLVYRYCPFDRTENVVLHPPSRQVWGNLTVFQQALWMVDEVEARWQSILSQYPNISTVEVMWGKQWPGSFDTAANTIAGSIGIHNANISFESSWDVGREHAGESQEELRVSTEYALQDRAYRKAMCYKYVPA